MNKLYTGVSVTSLIIVSLIFGTLYLSPTEFEINLNDGNQLAKYKEGVFKLYSGRYKVIEDYVSPECYDGGYKKVYKARGNNKYSNLSYYQDGRYHHIFQEIRFSKGNLTREFVISDSGIKETFHWTPTDDTLKCRLRIKYSSLELGEGDLIYSKNQQIYGLNTNIGFNVSLDWTKDKDKISMVKRYNNGNLHILTSPVIGSFSYDPDIIINDNNKPKPTDCKDIITTTCHNITVPDYGWVYTTYDCRKPLLLNYTSQLVKKPTAYCWKWDEGNITNSTPSHYDLQFSHQYYKILKGSFNWRDWRQIGSHQEVICKNTTTCVKQGWVNVSGKIIAYERFFCDLRDNKVCCVLENGEGLTGGEGGRYGDCRIERTSWNEDLLTGKKTFYNSAKVKLKKKNISLSISVVSNQ